MALPFVPTQIKSYSELRNAVMRWADRDDNDFDSQVGNFINFAEKQIYRSLRIPKLERCIYLPVRKGVAFIPADCLEIKSVLRASDGKPFRTTSLEQLHQMKATADFTRDDQELLFAQNDSRLYFFPKLTSHVPAQGQDENGEEVLFTYYRDVSELDNGPDDGGNELLTIAPDALLYLSLQHAALYVQDDEAAQKWGMLGLSAIAAIQEQADHMEFSGSPKAVKYPADEAGYDRSVRYL